MSIPDDLWRALESSLKQYKAISIKPRNPNEADGLKGLRFEDEFLIFAPSPHADETWAQGGEVVAREGDTQVFTGRILEFDGDNGEIYVDASGLTKEGRNDILKWSLSYKPFNFAAALKGAYERLEKTPDRLDRGLKGAFGEVPHEKSPHYPAGKDLPEDSEPGESGAWASEWGLIWGPPGTGKTETVARQLRRVSLLPGGKFLVVTPTNLAADQITLRLCRLLDSEDALKDGRYCRVYRGGRSAGSKLASEFPEALRSEEYDAFCAKIYRKIKGLEDEKKKSERKRASAEIARISGEIERLRSSLPNELEFMIRRSKVRVIALTTFKASQLVALWDSGPPFEKVIIDEAGMVSRAVCAALSTLAKSVLLAGDPKQIGPIFQTPEGLSTGQRSWLVRSGMSHLEDPGIANSRSDIDFLEYQHRMHPEIRKTVGEFAYHGHLKDGEGSRKIAKEKSKCKLLPKARSCCIELDIVAGSPMAAHHSRASTGRGYQRDSSAALACSLGFRAASEGLKVLLLSPYRAQVRLFRLEIQNRPAMKNMTVGTIHRQQGSEADVVILDLVKAAQSWNDEEINRIINVAASRAKKHFILIASSLELTTPIVKRLVRTMARDTPHPEILKDRRGQIELPTLEPLLNGDAAQSKDLSTLGKEIEAFRERLPLYSQQQVRLMDRKLREGHYLVRGVAGSGKSLILANWAAKTALGHPDSKVLITYFNKGLHNMVEKMLHDASKVWGVPLEKVQDRVDIVHAYRVDADAKYDAVFIDEAQDIVGERLKFLYERCKPQPNGSDSSLRNFILFYDDSQNIYGRKTLEELKDVLPVDISFAGRTSVLKESYRSTRGILNLAINLALDPKDIYKKPHAGLKTFMKVRELADENLLCLPEETSSGLYEVNYTDRVGIPPRVYEEEDEAAVEERVLKLVRGHIREEGVHPGDLLVISPYKPVRFQKRLHADGIRATAFGGEDGIDPLGMPAKRPGYVRCTTIFSCKGHESPVCIFANVQDLEKINWMKVEGAGDSDYERIRRAMLYVGVSRGMVRQYMVGTKCRFIEAGKSYAA